MTPYLIINDKYDPPIYLRAGATNVLDVPSQTTDRELAQVFVDLASACAPLHHRPDLYRVGWRVVPR